MAIGDKKIQGDYVFIEGPNGREEMFINPKAEGLGLEHIDRDLRLNEYLPDFPVSGISFAVIPTLKSMDIEINEDGDTVVTSLSEAISDTDTLTPYDNLEAPEVKFHAASKRYYIETNGIDSGLAIDDLAINRLVSSDGESGTIVMIGAFEPGAAEHVVWYKKNSVNNYSVGIRYGAIAPWTNKTFYTYFGGILSSNGRETYNDTPNAVVYPTTIRNINLSTSASTQDIIIDGATVTSGSGDGSFSSVINNSGVLSIGCSKTENASGFYRYSKVKMFALLFFDRQLNSEEIFEANEWVSNNIGDTI